MLLQFTSVDNAKSDVRRPRQSPLEEEEIATRLDSLAAQITADYQGLDLTVIAILNGSLIFMADLLRRIPLPLQLDCLRVRSYYSGMVSTGRVTFDPQALLDLSGRHVLLL